MVGHGAKAKAQKMETAKAKKEVNQRNDEEKEAASWDEGSNKRAKERAALEAKKEADRVARVAAKVENENTEIAELNAMRPALSKARKAKKNKNSKHDMSQIDAFLADETKEKKTKNKDKSVEMDNNIAPLQPNRNREIAEADSEGNIEASGLDNALAALGVNDSNTEKGPSRKAAYLAFESKEMIRLIEEYPSMRRSQLKNKIFQLWKKSPENPENRR